jgi:hypothetical protein
MVFTLTVPDRFDWSGLDNIDWVLELELFRGIVSNLVGGIFLHCQSAGIKMNK